MLDDGSSLGISLRLLLVLFLVASNGFFVAAEFSLVSVRKTRIDELVAARIGVPAMVANHFASMSLASRIKPQHLSNDAPSLMISCGLAMRSFDE